MLYLIILLNKLFTSCIYTLETVSILMFFYRKKERKKERRRDKWKLIFVVINIMPQALSGDIQKDPKIKKYAKISQTIALCEEKI